jgi:hypothetical protein
MLAQRAEIIATKSGDEGEIEKVEVERVESGFKEMLLVNPALSEAERIRIYVQLHYLVMPQEIRYIQEYYLQHNFSK